MTNTAGPHAEAVLPLRPFRPFTMRFSPTPRGARLARRLAACRLDAWGWPYGCGTHDDVLLIVGELSANAVQHGLVPGRDFRLRLGADIGAIRVEVTDARAERLPVPPSAPPPPPAGEAMNAESGRGLLLVAELASHWGYTTAADGLTKTVWAEYGLLSPATDADSAGRRPARVAADTWPVFPSRYCRR